MRQWMTTIAAVAAAALLAACAHTQGEVATTTEMGSAGAARDTLLPEWETSIAANPEYDVAGEVEVEALPDGGFHAFVQIRGGEPNHVYPWHVHAGGCGSGGSIVGSASAYPVMTTDGNGHAEADATVSQALDPDGDYYVNVHASPSDLGTIVACGELRRD